MKIARNEKGIAFVMVLVFSTIALAVVAGMIFMVTQGTQLSGGHRFFRTAEEASLGGTEIAKEFIVLRGNFTAALQAGLTNYWQTVDPCIAEKLNLSRGNWTAACDANERSLDAAMSEDFNFELGDFRVFAKIVDTVEGNSDTGGILGPTGGKLGGMGVVAATTGLVSPPHAPYLYRVEVQAQDINFPRERSRLSVLYAY